jgi:predicted 3-demethylubiquinone-9 3-methyltransferase (glyoxalase superfamily)
MPRVTPFWWFDGNAEEAVNFYASVFKDAKITGMTRYGDAGPGPKGAVMTATIQIGGQEFTALNGGPDFKFSPATSFVIHCEDQDEVDHYWDRLGEGGKAHQCGWLDDRFGVTWQVAPDALLRLIKDEDPKKSQRVMRAMMQMTKIDIAALERAAAEPAA